MFAAACGLVATLLAWRRTTEAEAVEAGASVCAGSLEDQSFAPEPTGSMPLFLMTGAAAGAARNLINAAAASGSCAPRGDAGGEYRHLLDFRRDRSQEHRCP